METIIDFLIALATPMEGVDYAIAPLLLAGLAQLPGAIKGVSAAKAAKEQAQRDEARAARDQAAAQRALANLRAGKLEFEPVKDKLSERYTDAYEMSMSRAPEQMAQEAREQALASQLATGGDPRSQMQNMLAASQFGSQARQDAMAGLSQRKAATSTLAGLEQGIEDANKERFRAQFEKELTGAQQLFTASRARKEQAQDAQAEAKRARNQALIGAAVGTIGGAMTMPGVNKFGDIFKSAPGALSTVGKGYDLVKTTGENIALPQTQTYNISPTQVPDVVTPGTNVFGTEVMGPGGVNLGYGQSSYGFEKGGKVGKTGGVFDHETNKKALIDEESGEKEAELTGDETMFVFNPKQTSTFEKLVKGNDASGLMKFMKKLLNKPQFNK
jgi:hypothetical protein